MNDLASYPLNMWSTKPQSLSPSASAATSSTTASFARPDLQKTAVMGVPAVMPVKMKRGHVSKACTNCRKMHAGCYHARPCSRCVFHRMESTCIDVPRKKRMSKKKKPEEGGEFDSSYSTEELISSSSADTPRQSSSFDIASNNTNTNEKIWKDTFNELFGEIASPQVPFSPSPSPSSTGYLQPLLFSDLLGGGSDKPSNDLSTLEPKRDMRDLVREMDELRRSNLLLETKLNTVTTELVEMRQKMQQMLQLLGGFFMPQTPTTLGQADF